MHDWGSMKLFFLLTALLGRIEIIQGTGYGGRGFSHLGHLCKSSTSLIFTESYYHCDGLCEISWAEEVSGDDYTMENKLVVISNRRDFSVRARAPSP